MLNKILLNLSLFTLCAGCGSAGNTLWEVSRLEGMTPNSCYPNGKPPTDTTTTMGVQASVGPWELYEGPESKMYLVLADKKTVIEGTKADSFSFQWTITNVDTTPPQGMGTLTDTSVNTVAFKVSGETMSGTWEEKETHTCAGTSCSGVTLQPNCTVTSQISGRKLDVSRYKVY
jgi:hypothetical protein